MQEGPSKTDDVNLIREQTVLAQDQIPVAATAIEPSEAVTERQDVTAPISDVFGGEVPPAFQIFAKLVASDGFSASPTTVMVEDRYELKMVYDPGDSDTGQPGTVILQGVGILDRYPQAILTNLAPFFLAMGRSVRLMLYDGYSQTQEIATLHPDNPQGETVDTHQD